MDICGQWGGRASIVPGRRSGSTRDRPSLRRPRCPPVDLFSNLDDDTPKATRNRIEREKAPDGVKLWREGVGDEGEEFFHSAEHSAQSRFK